MALTLTGAVLDGETVGVRCEEGRIAALGPEVVASPATRRSRPAARHWSNPAHGHTHAAMTLFRGSGGDLPLMPWLEEKIWPVEGKLDADDVYWGARLACAEMIRTGTTRFWDMYWHPKATAGPSPTPASTRPSAPRCSTTTATPGACASAPWRASTGRRWAGDRPRARPALDLHGQRSLAALDRRAWRAAPAADQIHLAETEREASDCVAAHGLRPAAYLDSVGILCERTVLAHRVWLDEEELELIAARVAPWTPTRSPT